MRRRAYAFTGLALSLILGAATGAHAEDAHTPPLTPEQIDQQRVIFMVIFALIGIGVAFYYFRRWQTLKGGNVVEGRPSDD